MTLQTILKKAQKEIERSLGKRVRRNRIDVYLLKGEKFYHLHGKGNSSYEVYILDDNDIRISLPL